MPIPGPPPPSGSGFPPDQLLLDPAQVCRRAQVAVPTEGTDDWTDLLEFLGEMQGLLSDWLRRPLTVQQGTSLVYAGPDGRIVMPRTPVVTVVAVTPAAGDPTLLPVGAFADTYANSFGSVFDAGPVRTSGYGMVIGTVDPACFLTSLYPPGSGFTVTYTAGLDGPNLPGIRGLLMIGARRAVKAWKEDTDGLQAVTLGDGQGYTFQRITGNQVNPATAGYWTDEELDKVSRYRRRLAV